MSTVSSSSKVAYMYDQASDTWYALAGTANTNVAYEWNAAHTFSTIVTVNDVIRAKAGVNRFLTTADRDTILGLTPPDGTTCFVQTVGDSSANQIQVYRNGAWHDINETKVVNYTASATLKLSDSGKTVNMNVSTANQLTIPLNSSVAFPTNTRFDIIQTGAGQTEVVATSGVTLNSKNNNKKIAARYSGATLIKLDTDTWILIGDLTA
jgi:mannose-6-phosphate isomerase-like protein (cupin superfamily)